MNIEKVILNTTLKGVNNQWDEGEVLFPPLPLEVMDEIKLERDTVRVVYSEKQINPPQFYAGAGQIKTMTPIRIKRVKRSKR